MKNLFHIIKIILIDLFEVIFISSVVFICVFFLFIGQSLRVSGLSMYPTFQDNEVIMIEKLSIKLKPLQRGDIIVFKSPQDPEKPLIKRIIGLPHEVIEIKEGFVYINNQKLNEPYIQNTLTKQEGMIKENIQYVIGKDSYIVMGDNRTDSEDSREFGPIETQNIMGKVLLVYDPIQNFRMITSLGE